jgi:hypothetical protein
MRPVFGFLWPELLAGAIRFAQKTAALCRTGVWEWQRPWPQFPVQRIFCFLVVIFSGSLSAELNSLNFLGE